MDPLEGAPPLTIALLLIVGATILYLDRAVERGVEYAGTQAVGARVDLDAARVGLREGTVSLRGLAVTDPGAPMTNLFEAEEIILDLGLLAALERKVVIDTMAVRGLRFGTPRTTSGALPEGAGGADEGPGAVRRAVDEWRSRVRIPPISLSTLTQAVNVSAISAESLATLRAARAARAFADTARAALLADLQALDPRPTIDSAEALAARLRTASLRTLGLGGVRQAVTDVRRTVSALNQLDDRLRAFQEETRGNAKGLTERLEAIPAARTADYAYARSLLSLPTFDIPAIGPQLFSPIIAEQVGEILYWTQLIEAYLPPGLQRQMKPGPQRMRASGTDVLFPKATTYPDFLTRLAELSLAIGGEDAAAGDYTARIVGLTTQPAVYGASDPVRHHAHRGTHGSARRARLRVARPSTGAGARLPPGRAHRDAVARAHPPGPRRVRGPRRGLLRAAARSHGRLTRRSLALARDARAVDARHAHAATGHVSGPRGSWRTRSGAR